MLAVASAPMVPVKDSPQAVPRIRVLLVDDHSLVRAGIRAMLSSVAGIEVVGEASGGTEAVEMVGTFLPDVVILDISMPGSGGIDALRRISADYPPVRTIILSMHDSEEYVLEALRAGAAGYLLKDCDIDEFVLAVVATAKGGGYLTPSITRHLIDVCASRSSSPGGGTGHLTTRQRQIVQQIALGSSTREIAHVLGLSPKTVESHRSQLMERLRVHDVAGVVRYAVRAGIVETDD